MAKKTITALDGVRALNQKLISAAQARYESNQASQQDLLKAQIELSKVDIERFNWNEKVHLAEAHFSHILSRPLHTQYRVTDPPPSPMVSMTRLELEQMAVRVRPELKAFEAGIRRAKTNRWLAASSWLPQVTGRIEARQFHGEGNIREYDTFLGLTVPVWSLLKGASGEWTSASKEVGAAEAAYDEMKNEVLLAVHEAYSKIQSAAYAVKTYDTLIVPQAKQQEEVALAGYEAGRTSVLELVDAQRTFKDTQIAYATVTAEYERGLSDLRLAIGGDWNTQP